MIVFKFNHIGVLTIMNELSKCSTTRRLALQILCTFAAAATVSCKAQNQNTGGLKDYSNSAAANQERAEAAREQCREQAFAAKEQQIQACQAQSYAASSPLAREIFASREVGCVDLADRTLGDELRACQNTFMAMNQPSINGSPGNTTGARHPGGYIEWHDPESAAELPGPRGDREDRDEEYLIQKLEEERTARMVAQEENDGF